MYRSISLAQWTFLHRVADNVERMIRQEQANYQANYQAEAKEIGETDYL